MEENDDMAFLVGNAVETKTASAQGHRGKALPIVAQRSRQDF